MKVICPVHGAHFQDEIDDLVDCKYFWKKLAKMSRVPRELRVKLIEHLWSWDTDAVAGKYGWNIGFFFSGTKIGQAGKFVNEFERDVPGYKDWTDAQRRNYQRRLFKRRYTKERKAFNAIYRKRAVHKLGKPTRSTTHVRQKPAN